MEGIWARENRAPPDKAAIKIRMDTAARAGENLWLANNFNMPGIPLRTFVSLILGVRCTK